MSDNSKKPLISVIMSVYNEERYLQDAIDSILAQTVSDFELIIVDDGSTDRTREILSGYRDPRIQVLFNDENCGLTVNLNRALDVAEGIFIARMDGDDIAYPNRLEKELEYLKRHPELMLISCRTKTFGDQNLQSDITGSSEYLRCRMLVRPVLAHPGFMARREVFRELGYQYDESFRQAQDYDLAARLTRRYSIGICPEVLLEYRAHEGQVSNKVGGSQFRNADRVRERLLQELGIALTEQEWDIYHQLILEKPSKTVDTYIQAVRIIDRVVEQNDKLGIYDKVILKDTLGRIVSDWIIRSKVKSLYMRSAAIFHGDWEYMQAYRHEWQQVLKRKLCMLKS